jgi:epoxyqueuosine reductase
MNEIGNSEIKALAREAGLAVSAVTTAEPFDGLSELLKQRIDAGHLAGMDWFTHQRAEESSTALTLHGNPLSILSVGLPYYTVDPGKPEDGTARGRISRYARGIDYHRTLKQRMERLKTLIEEQLGRSLDARLLTDTARIVDRAVAARSGLGWYGKHTCVIVPGRGSWVMLGELVLDVAIAPDLPLAKNCGRCTICLDRCPTGAIVAPYTVDAPKCLSFQTIEQRGAIPHEIRPFMGDWVFGCDVCQEVCPYTGAAKPVDDPDVMPASIENAYPPLSWLLEISEAEFRAVYRHTPVVRTKRRGLARNAAVALGNIGTERDTPVLRRALAEHDEPLVRGHSAWALARLTGRDARPDLERQHLLDPDDSVRTEAAFALEFLAT